MFYTFFSPVLIWLRLKLLTYKVCPKVQLLQLCWVFLYYCASKCQDGPVMVVKSHTKYGISVDARAGNIETRPGPNWKQLNQQQNLAKVSSLCNDLLLKSVFQIAMLNIFCFLNMHFFKLAQTRRPKAFRPPCSGGQPRIHPPAPLFGRPAPNPPPRPPCSGG